MENAGKLAWIGPLIDILLSANAETVDYQLSQMFQTLGSRNQKNYYRINPSLKNASPSMDNVREENIENLIQAGSGLYRREQRNAEPDCSETHPGIKRANGKWLLVVGLLVGRCY